MRSAALIVFGLVACAKPAPQTSPEDVAAKYFTALANGDCPGITANTGGGLAKEIATLGCAASLDEAKSHQMKYLGADNVRPDGRDPNARLIDVRLFADGKEKKVIARLELEGNAWKVVTP
jgi:hypothetical protein